MGVQMHSHAISASCLLCIAACLFDPLPSILAPLGGGAMVAAISHKMFPVLLPIVL